ncbi:hypothetical protein Ga0123461_1810 [Mariprofundus aestuarium]|uniref:Uncharacterized protein n=1 Tax=Mariprofundus aestuarium TaxID=1921086 RepID=A0A2K8KZ58_MARES|nr:hypothetical protein [Mariprofundus aestuarium]ATX80223.1 hypothetical protein Ga0123461_1810 [Mariprofundus aestuarium]
MVILSQVMALVNKPMTQVLLVAESSLSESQFRAFRKLALDAFGKNGLEKELKELFDQQER